MTLPVDITDPTIAKAYAHPLRMEIMELLDDRVASPSQISEELGSALSLTSYHVRQLASWGLVKLVRRRQVRGSIEHFYTAVVRPTVYDETWAKIPPIVRRALVGSSISQLGRELSTAVERGGFDPDDMHFTRTRLTLTPEGWQAVVRELASMLDRIDHLKEAETEKLTADPTATRVEATLAMVLFESPWPDTFDARETHSSTDDEMADITPSG